MSSSLHCAAVLLSLGAFGGERPMGAWCTAAWDNDSDADWYGDPFDSTGLAKHVAEALNHDPEEDADVIRAAAFLLIDP